MSRFYIRPERIKGDRIYVNGSEVHHILNVMRLKKGDSVVVFDGSDKEYFGIIEESFKKKLMIKIERINRRVKKRICKITLAQAIPKKDKFDYIIQKTTELDVDIIIPMNTERTVVRLENGKISARLNRYRRIALEAAKQCGRVDIPVIGEYQHFQDVLKKISTYDLSIMPVTSFVKKERLKKVLSSFNGKSIFVLVGPEGGFTMQELKLASAKGVKFVSLGDNILRSETAAIATLAIIDFVLEKI